MTAACFSFDRKLDADFLRNLYEDDKEHATVVFEIFIQSIGIQLNEIEDCFTAGEPESFRKQIHKIKPVLSFVGLTGLTNKAGEIEEACYGITDIIDISALYKGFRNELIEMIPVVANELVRLKA